MSERDRIGAAFQSSQLTTLSKGESYKTLSCPVRCKGGGWMLTEGKMEGDKENTRVPYEGKTKERQLSRKVKLMERQR